MEITKFTSTIPESFDHCEIFSDKLEIIWMLIIAQSEETKTVNMYSFHVYNCKVTWV